MVLLTLLKPLQNRKTFTLSYFVLITHDMNGL